MDRIRLPGLAGSIAALLSQRRRAFLSVSGTVLACLPRDLLTSAGKGLVSAVSTAVPDAGIFGSHLPLHDLFLRSVFELGTHAHSELVVHRPAGLADSQKLP